MLISQTGLAARHIFSCMYSVPRSRKFRYDQDTAPDLEGLPGRTADGWHWDRSLAMRDYVLSLIKKMFCDIRWHISRKIYASLLPCCSVFLLTL